MNNVRIGIIGFGIMGQGHCKTLKSIDSCTVTAVCDQSEAQFAKAREKGILDGSEKCFSDYKSLIDSGLCDAIAVVTPHPLHLEISKYAFSRKLHVMCDKPITTTVSEADEMLDAWKKSGTKFSTMYSLRASPINEKIKQLVSSGEIGKVRRVEMTCTNWLRTQIYFDSQSWRGTWNGEGGGLLLNQAPHNLDMLYWCFGPAASVTAKLASRFHKMETEDEVMAWITTSENVPITFYVTTGEAPGKDHLEIVAENGTLIKENSKLVFKRLEEPLGKIIAESKDGFAVPKFNVEEINLPEATQSGHAAVFESFFKAILEKDESLMIASRMRRDSFRGACKCNDPFVVRRKKPETACGQK